MNVYQAFSVLSGIVTVIAFAMYIQSVFKGMRPAKASWIIWSGLNAIAGAGMLMRGEMNGQMLVSFFGAIIVATLAVRRGDSGWTLTDKVCVAGAVISAVCLLVKPEFAIALSQIANVIAAFPTFRNAWVNPHKESVPAWGVTITASVLALLSVAEWSIASGTQPLTFFGIQAVILGILLFRR